MRILTTTPAILLTLFTIGCSNSGSKSEAENKNGIELNNGEKWQVNEEMTPFVVESENILNQYNGGDYLALAEQLGDENKKLIKSCTMDGKSHDELHKWLHPHLQMVKALKDAENEEEANKIIVELKESFITFHTYFQ